MIKAKPKLLNLLILLRLFVKVAANSTSNRIGLADFIKSGLNLQDVLSALYLQKICSQMQYLQRYSLRFGKLFYKFNMLSGEEHA